MDVSVIIVNYNTCDLTIQCLQSIFKRTEELDFEVIVVDNASTDNTVVCLKEQFPQIKVIECSENLGFGRANNLGAKFAQGKYLFLLNSDTILIGNIIKDFYDFMQSHKEIASCGGNLLNITGANTISHGRFPTLFQEFSDIGFSLLYRRRYRQKWSVGQKINEGNIGCVDYISGADIFIRKDVFNDMNGFDEQIFMYYEETDLYYRMRKSKLKSCLLPYACLIHLEGGSFKKKYKVNAKRFEIMLKSKLYFFDKHYGHNKRKLVKLYSVLSVFTHGYVYKKQIFKILSIILRS